MMHFCRQRSGGGHDTQQEASQTNWLLSETFRSHHTTRAGPVSFATSLERGDKVSREAVMLLILLRPEVANGAGLSLVSR